MTGISSQVCEPRALPLSYLAILWRSTTELSHNSIVLYHWAILWRSTTELSQYPMVLYHWAIPISHGALPLSYPNLPWCSTTEPPRYPMALYRWATSLSYVALPLSYLAVLWCSTTELSRYPNRPRGDWRDHSANTLCVLSWYNLRSCPTFPIGCCLQSLTFPLGKIISPDDSLIKGWVTQWPISSHGHVNRNHNRDWGAATTNQISSAGMNNQSNETSRCPWPIKWKV